MLAMETALSLVVKYLVGRRARLGLVPLDLEWASSSNKRSSPDDWLLFLKMDQTMMHAVVAYPRFVLKRWKSFQILIDLSFCGFNFTNVVERMYLAEYLEAL